MKQFVADEHRTVASCVWAGSDTLAAFHAMPLKWSSRLLPSAQQLFAEPHATWVRSPVPAGEELTVHLEPSQCRISPPVPTAQQSCPDTHATPLSSFVVPGCGSWDAAAEPVRLIASHPAATASTPMVRAASPIGRIHVIASPVLDHTFNPGADIDRTSSIAYEFS
jgi:hypothetical protein